MGEEKDKYNSILEYWKGLEQFLPHQPPKVKLKYEITEKKNDRKLFMAWDSYAAENSQAPVPYQNYIDINEYYKNRDKKEDPDGAVNHDEQSQNLEEKENPRAFNRVCIYFGCYKLNQLMKIFAELYNLNEMEKERINNMQGQIFAFKITVDLDGNIIDPGIELDFFFFTIIDMIQEKRRKSRDSKGDYKINAKQKRDIDTILTEENDFQIKVFSDVKCIKDHAFEKMGIINEENYGLVADIEERVICCKGMRVEDEDDITTSFYLDDLEKVQKNYVSNDHLKRYIGSMMEARTTKTIIDTDIKALQKWLDPSKYPMAKFPSIFSPTLMQQVAINLAISETKETDIFSVNGPPGTGKTTLLKEIIASHVYNAAKYLSELPKDYKFEEKGIPSKYKQTYIKIPEVLAKHGILVVSNNNNAVENISRELPDAYSVTADKTRTGKFDISQTDEIYFTKVARKILEKEEIWGLISSPMGRKENVKNVLYSCRFISDKNVEDYEKNNRIFLNVPREINEQSLDLDSALNEFQAAEKRVLDLRTGLQQKRNCFISYYEVKEQASNIEYEIKKKGNDCRSENEIREKMGEVQEKISEYNRTIEELKDEEFEMILQAQNCRKDGAKVGFFGRLRSWLGLQSYVETEEMAQCRQKIQKAEDERDDLERGLEELRACHNLKQKLANLKKIEKARKEDVDQYNIDPDFELVERNIMKDKFQNSCPWTDDQYDKAREELFYASLQLRKAFILHHRQQIGRNLNLLFGCYVSNDYEEKDKNEMMTDLINTVSLVIPVISSTAASVGRFLKNVRCEGLGTLIIDEAGQLSPASAVGAIYRSKRAIIVGDPLQVPPVMNMPKVLNDILARRSNVDPAYTDLELSTQVLADRANVFCGMIENREVGCPLLVHRRCIDPMFSISNRISYGGKMIMKTNPPADEDTLTSTFSVWIDIKGNERGNKDHFVKRQGDVVCYFLHIARIKNQGTLFSDYKRIFIITPFTSVKDGLHRCIMEYFGNWYDKDDINEWLEHCVGTIHTFQGKDADEVVFVLGCSSKSRGAMHWVVQKPNLINVACTRAKYRLIVVGDASLWKEERYFEDIIYISASEQEREGYQLKVVDGEMILRKSNIVET